MITAFSLTKAFGSFRVLNDLELAAAPGEVTLLVGANGAGKTTLLRVLCGLTAPDRGSALIGGFDLRRERRAALASLSFLPQASRFHARLSTRQVVEFYARLRGRDDPEVDRALTRWGLETHAHIATAKLSGGLRQRLALAVFTLPDAPVLLLDEPGLSLDPEWRQRLQEFLLEEARRGKTVLVTTHLLGEWEGRVDRCLVLEQGRISGELAPDRLRAAFANLASPTHLPEAPAPVMSPDLPTPNETRKPDAPLVPPQLAVVFDVGAKAESPL